MSYQFKPNLIYRMPTHFGPMMGPRQAPDGRSFNNIKTPETTTLSVSFRSNPEQLKALLPECFELGDEAIVTVHCSQMKKIEWLAGRGYSMLGISFPAKFRGKVDQINGMFLSVLWENLCDPIITGREELGFSKLYAEISAPIITPTSASVSAGWLGFNFLDIEIDELQLLTESKQVSENQQAASVNKSDGLLHYKYIPKTGAWGSADVAYPVFTPGGDNKAQVTKKLLGKGRLNWNKARWEDLPTLYNVVNTLAQLEIIEYLEASLSYSIGGKSLSDQRALK